MKTWYHFLLLCTFPSKCSTSMVVVTNTTDSNNSSIDDHTNTWMSLNLTASEKLKLKLVQQSRAGFKKVLVVRVSSVNGEVPEESLDEIQGAVYGTGPNPLHVPSDASLVAQFRAVTHGRLILEPLIAPNLARPGLLDVVIDESIVSKTYNNSSTSRFELIVRPAMMNAVEKVLGKVLNDLADHVLFCLPGGSLDLSVAGVGEVGGKLSFYHLGHCRKLDALMHEVGHNLYFHHAGIGTQEYGDMSDYMGGLEPVKREKSNVHAFFKGFRSGSESSPIDGAGYPRKAFNGHSHWNSGWFINRATEICPSVVNELIQIRLVSFVEYSNPDMMHGDLVLLRCGTLYIQYNRAKDYNKDSAEANRVTITQGFADGDISKRVASLAASESYRLPNYNEGGRELVFLVCHITVEAPGVIDYADVWVYIDGGNRQLACPVDSRTKRFVLFPDVARLEEPFRSVVRIVVFFTTFFIGCAILFICCVGMCCIYQDTKRDKKSNTDEIDKDVNQTDCDIESIQD